MTRPADDFTSTVDGAAAFERAHSEEPYDDPPSPDEVGGFHTWDEDDPYWASLAAMEPEEEPDE